MTIFDEFRKFIARGNVLDLAVGVLVGAAFGKIVSALTDSILMPIIGWLFGNIDFSNYFFRLGAIPPGYSGSLHNYAKLKEAGVAMIGYGVFFTQLVNFLIIAFVLFLMVRGINRVVETVEEERKATPDTTASPTLPSDPQLDMLREIRDELRRRNGGDAGDTVTSH